VLCVVCCVLCVVCVACGVWCYGLWCVVYGFVVWFVDELVSPQHCDGVLPEVAARLNLLPTRVALHYPASRLCSRRGWGLPSTRRRRSCAHPCSSPLDQTMRRAGSFKRGFLRCKLLGLRLSNRPEGLLLGNKVRSCRIVHPIPESLSHCGNVMRSQSESESESESESVLFPCGR